jgi:hypothetical protein
MEPEELEYLVGEFVREVAKRLKIQNAGLMFVDELRKLIKLCNAAISESLESFINTYCTYADFHRRVHEKELEGLLTPDDHQQLAHLVGQRNVTRDKLLETLAKLPQTD